MERHGLRVEIAAVGIGGQRRIHGLHVALRRLHHAGRGRLRTERPRGRGHPQDAGAHEANDVVLAPVGRRVESELSQVGHGLVAGGWLERAGIREFRVGLLVGETDVHHILCSHLIVMGYRVAAAGEEVERAGDLLGVQIVRQLV